MGNLADRYMKKTGKREKKWITKVVAENVSPLFKPQKVRMGQGQGRVYSGGEIDEIRMIYHFREGRANESQ